MFANVGFATCTAHFINQETWTLQSIVMGYCLKKLVAQQQMMWSTIRLLWKSTIFICPFLPWSCFCSQRYRAYYDCSRVNICTKESKRRREHKVARIYWPFAAVSNQKSIFRFTHVRRDTQGMSKSGQFFNSSFKQPQSFFESRWRAELWSWFNMWQQEDGVLKQSVTSYSD